MIPSAKTEKKIAVSFAAHSPTRDRDFFEERRLTSTAVLQSPRNECIQFSSLLPRRVSVYPLFSGPVPRGEFTESRLQILLFCLTVIRIVNACVVLFTMVVV